MRAILLLLVMTTLSGCWLTGSAGKEKKTSQNNAPASKSRTLTQTADDIRISAALHLDLAALKLYKPITATVLRGKVTYTGTVQTERDSLIALGVAWKQNGVKEVENNLKVLNKK